VPDDSRLLVFSPQGSSPFWKSVGDEIEVQAVENRAVEHPLTKALDLDAIRFEGARKVEPTEGSLVLAVSETGQPLIWKSQVGGRSAVVVNLDPAKGDFFLSPWFPAMVHGAALHLAERENSLLSTYPTGSQASDQWIGKRGFYQSTHGGVSVPFGGALMDRAETLLDGNGPKGNAQAVAAGYPLAFWLIVVAVIVLIGESLLYHRRKAG
jgi:hypothetical protein